MGAPYIEISAGDGSIPFFGIPFPSGQIVAGEPGSDLNAVLIGMRSTFGFNEAPHTFELDFIPSGTGYGHGASGNLPSVNTQIEMYISGFYLNGFVTHADWNSASNGTTVNINIKDRRTTLDQYKITTDDFGDNLPSGVCSIPREYRLQYGITESNYRIWGSTAKTETEAEDTRFLEYRRIIERGATYEQTLNAIERVFGSGVRGQLPTISNIQTNIGQDITSLRWKFGIDTLRDAISQITVDTAFDWYWNMSQDSVALINKKTPFSIPEERILDIINAYGGSGIENVTGISYGTDKVTEPVSIHLLGAHQEGFLNSPKLSAIDGVETIYDGDPSGSGVLIFEPAWSNLTVGFYDANGFYRTYVPTEKELQCAIKGIEHWSYFKIYQSESSANGGFGLAPDVGSVAAQHDDFESRLDPRQPLAELLSNPDTNLRVISNRRDAESNWVIEFFNRINQHAQRHYGKSYVATNALTRDNDVLFLSDAAWANVENQRQDPSSPFVDDYEISRDYGIFSPFYNPSNGRISAHCRLPAGTVYGPLGEDSPASFVNWTEDAAPFNASGDGQHYIPVNLSVVGSRVLDPRNDGDFSFEHYPEQTVWCQLPQMAASGFEENEVFGNLATLVEYVANLGTSGLEDLINPTELVIPYPSLSGVAVPIRSVKRYGAEYPTVWSSGTPDIITGTRIIVDDDMAPWVEFPEGTQTSVDKLNTRAFDVINSLISIQDDAQYVEVGQIGLPQLSFDTFAVQTPNASGFIGEREHGVNSVSIYYGTGGLTTTYKAQSFYDTPRQPSPLQDRTRSRLEGVIHPIDFVDLGDFLTGLGLGDPGPGDQVTNGGNAVLNFDFERQEAAEVTVVNNVFNEQQCSKLNNGQTVPTEEAYYVQVTRNAQFAYVETGVTFPVGTSVWGHTLNSLQVTVIVNPDDNSVARNKILATEIDQHSVLVDNQTGGSFVGTLMITNGEGIVRPTNETIRNSSEVTDAGVFCQDGYLNYGDNCVYYHKRVNGEELAYLTGGRKLGGGQIITVEESNGDGTYNVSILGDPHSRWICNIPSLNDVSLALESQAQIAEWGTTQIKPGPESTGFTIVPAAAGGGIAVQITSLDETVIPVGFDLDPTIVATVQELTASGTLASATYSNVYILPDPAYADVGDKGTMITYTPQDDVDGLSDIKYVQISKNLFQKYSV
jgi:hypothetical protein